VTANGNAEIVGEVHKTHPAVLVKPLRNHQLPPLEVVQQHLEHPHVAELPQLEAKFTQIGTLLEQVLEV
jgi:hypothetical protein